jgi:hypothetical protein
VTGTRKIPGVVFVHMRPIDSILVVEYDKRVTDEAKVTAAVQVVVENVH